MLGAGAPCKAPAPCSAGQDTRLFPWETLTASSSPVLGSTVPRKAASPLDPSKTLWGQLGILQVSPKLKGQRLPSSPLPLLLEGVTLGGCPPRCQLPWGAGCVGEEA